MASFSRKLLSSRFFRTLLILLVLIVIFAALHRQILTPLANFLVVSEQPVQADLIRVLGGSPDRYLYGAELYKQGYAPKILFSLWDDYMPLLQRSKTEIISEYAIAEGIPEDAIDFAPAESTYHEAQITKTMIESNRLNSVLVVSSPYHMRRIKMIFDHVIGDRAELIYVPVPDEWTDFRRDWWTNEESTVALLHEYIAIPYYFFKYIFLK